MVGAPAGSHDARRVVDLIERAQQRLAQVEDGAALVWSRPQRLVDAGRQAALEVAALTAQRRHERAGAATAALLLRVDAGERLVEHQRE